MLQIEKYYNYKNEFKKFKNKIDCLKKSQIELNNRIYKNITNPKVSNVAIYSKDNIVSFKSKKPKIIYCHLVFLMLRVFLDIHYFLMYMNGWIIHYIMLAKLILGMVRQTSPN